MQRYRVQTSGYGAGDEHEDKNGKWVKYLDAVETITEHFEEKLQLLGEISRLQDVVSRMHAEIVSEREEYS